MTPNKQIQYITIKLKVILDSRGTDFACKRQKTDESQGNLPEQNCLQRKFLVMEHAGQGGLNTNMPTIVFSLGPTKPLPSYD